MNILSAYGVTDPVLLSICADIGAPLDHSMKLTGRDNASLPLWMAALALQKARFRPKDNILAIGAGSGVFLKIFGKMNLNVFCIESDPAMARQVIKFFPFCKTCVFRSLSDGLPEHAPYDGIVIDGGVEHIPAVLLDQLKPGGRLAAVMMNGHAGHGVIHEKIKEKLVSERIFDGTVLVLEEFRKRQTFKF